MKVVLGLGSNVGDRESYLDQAKTMLEDGKVITNIVLSSCYETEALLLPNAPDEWNMPYLNRALSGATSYNPENLLIAIKHIEETLGRQDRGRWSPREIDIDILAYGNEVVTLRHLRIPHSMLLERAFALVPFAQIWPDWCYPVAGEHYGKTAAQLSAKFILKTRDQ